MALSHSDEYNVYSTGVYTCIFTSFRGKLCNILYSDVRYSFDQRKLSRSLKKKNDASLKLTQTVQML